MDAVLGRVNEVGSRWQEFNPNALGRKWTRENGVIKEEEADSKYHYTDESMGWMAAKNVLAIHLAPFACALRAADKFLEAIKKRENTDERNEALKSGVKHLLVGTFLWYEPTRKLVFGYGLATVGLLAYSVYKPFDCRVRLTEAERWYTGDIEHRADTQLDGLRPSQRLWAIARGQQSLAHLLCMIKVPGPKAE